MPSSPQAPALAGAFPVSEAFLTHQPSPGVLATLLLLGALGVLCCVVLIIVRRVVDKARPEDLPEVLTGLGHVFSSLAGFLPWGKTRDALPAPAPEPTSQTIVPAQQPVVTVVSGQIVVPPSTRAISSITQPGEGAR